jgi:hypothetical protein
MEPNFSNHNAEIDAAVREMRAENAPPEMAQRALTALREPKPADKSYLPLAIRLAGFAGTVAALAISTLPRSGQGLAWGQVVTQVQRAPRVHEVSEMRSLKGMRRSMERWSDGGKYSLQMWMEGRLVTDSRFDGETLFRRMGRQPFAVVSRLDPKQRRHIPDVASYWDGVSSIDEFVKRENAEPVGEPERKDENGVRRLRYELALRRWGKGATGSRGRMYAYVDIKTSRVIRWEALDSAGEVVGRGTVEYPAEVEPDIFRPPAKLDVPVYDMDLAHRRLTDSMKRGVATVKSGAARATVRAVLLDSSGNLTVLWTGAPPNGDLRPPVLVEGIPTTLSPYGVRAFTTSRGLEPTPYAPSTVLGKPLGGMTIHLDGKAPKRLTLRIPVFTADGSVPVKTESGEVVGHRSRFVGYDTVRNVEPFKIPMIYDFSQELGLMHVARRAK